MILIRPFDPWKGKLCTCPQKYSLSPYTGCEHGCLYCYASSYIPRFYQAREKKDFLKRLRKELEKIPANSYLSLSNSSDPYQPIEKRKKLTRGLLKMLSEFDFKIMIITKSDLILEDLDLLLRLKKLAIAFTLTTLEEKISKKIEPRAPSPQRRLQAMTELSQNFPVVCRFDPLIYPLNTREIKEVVKIIKETGAKQIITSTFKARRDSLKRMTAAFPEHASLWQELYQQKGEKIQGYYYLPQEMRRELIEEVRSEAIKNGLHFSSCREGFAHLNTATCDASQLFGTS